LGEVVPEGGALSARPFYVGEHQQLIAEAWQGIAAPLVNNDEEQVFARVQGATPSWDRGGSVPEAQAIEIFYLLRTAANAPYGVLMRRIVLDTNVFAAAGFNPKSAKSIEAASADQTLIEGDG